MSALAPIYIVSAGGDVDLGIDRAVLDATMQSVIDRVRRLEAAS